MLERHLIYNLVMKAPRIAPGCFACKAATAERILGQIPLAWHLLPASRRTDQVRSVLCTACDTECSIGDKEPAPICNVADNAAVRLLGRLPGRRPSSLQCELTAQHTEVVVHANRVVAQYFAVLLQSQARQSMYLLINEVDYLRARHAHC